MPGFARVTAYVLADGCLTDRPSSLTEILGRPYFLHLLDAMVPSGLCRVVCCTCGGKSGRRFEDAFGASYRGMDILYSHSEEFLGSGGSLLLALSRYPSPLALAVRGGGFVDADLSKFLSRFRKSGLPAGILLAQNYGAARCDGIKMDRHGRVTTFSAPPAESPELVDAGFSLFRPEILSDIRFGQATSLKQEIFPALAAAGRLGAFALPNALFFDIAGEGPACSPNAAHFLLKRAERIGPAAVFLDRDGTVIVERNYLGDPAGVKLLPGAASGLRHMRALGLPLVLVSNQSGVGRGYFDMGAVQRVHGRLLDLLAAEGTGVDAIYVCPHAPEAGCSCRKPLPGLIERAAQELDIRPEQSFVIGDKPCDVELGLSVGATTFLVTTGYGERHVVDGRARYVVHDLDEAAKIIERQLC